MTISMIPISQQQPLQTLQSPNVNPLSKHHGHKQFLCSDREGWGPISNERWDLTPCSLDTLLIFVAVWGVLAGLGAIIYLKRRASQDVKKNWHFYAKL